MYVIVGISYSCYYGVVVLRLWRMLLLELGIWIWIFPMNHGLIIASNNLTNGACMLQEYFLLVG